VPNPTHPASPRPRSRHELTDTAARLENLSGVLAVSLAWWADRENARDKAAARRAANTAVDAIDGMLAGLHAARQQMLAEARAYDDATAARTNQILAESRTLLAGIRAAGTRSR
jgi:hypothetical protein